MFAYPLISQSLTRFLAFLVVFTFFWTAFSLITRAESASPDDPVIVDSEVASVIKAGLRWLASKQLTNGSWSGLSGGANTHPVALTGYALLAFMATGNLPEDGEYGRTVALGAQFLLDSIQPDGTFRGVAGGQYMYNHGIATIALTELYGESKSQVIRAKIERLIKVIVNSQHSSGGWRYNTSPIDADISVTVMQVVALRSAMTAGFAVPQNTIDKAVAYIRSCADAPTGGFAYQPGGGPGYARTAAAIYSLQVCGQYDDPKVKSGSDYLFAHCESQEFWMYGSYYAAAAQYMIGGETWKKWHDQYRALLLSKVSRDGDKASWTMDWNDIYATAIAVKMLAMPCHYLPLDQR